MYVQMGKQVCLVTSVECRHSKLDVDDQDDLDCFFGTGNGVVIKHRVIQKQEKR